MILRNPFRKITDSLRLNLDNSIALVSISNLTFNQVISNWKNSIKCSKQFFKYRIIGLLYYFIISPVKIIISNFNFVFFSKENDYNAFLDTKLNLFNPMFYPIKKVW